MLNSLQLPWCFRIADLVVVKINDANTGAMFYSAFAQRMKKWLPARIMFQVIGHMPGILVLFAVLVFFILVRCNNIQNFVEPSL